MSIPAGLLRDRVDVLRQRPGTDHAGQRDGQWAEVRRMLPAQVKFSGGSEGLRGDRQESIGGYVVRMRPAAGVLVEPLDRLRVARSAGLAEGTLLEVDSVGDPDGLGRELALVCRTVG